jgi:hypothetical protein
VNEIPVRSFNQEKSNLNVENPRCLKLFLNSCKNKATRETYTNHLDSFLKQVEKDHHGVGLFENRYYSIAFIDFCY